MDALRRIIRGRQSGLKYCGIPSFCTANNYVIEACIRQSARFDDYVLLEATANQVNQFGGYTGMTPADYRDFIYEIADRNHFDHSKLILGGDHLGPLTWANEPEESAMAKAVELVRLFVLAGFKKIHLDTSMRLASDSCDEALSDDTIARRGAVLYKACEEAYQELLKKNPYEAHPVYIIGSEVPIPGGAMEAESSISVTRPTAVKETIAAYKKQLTEIGYPDAFENIIGLVVQPGVEYGDDEIFHYNRSNAAELTNYMKNYPSLVMEGHSTDYQSPEELRQMVEDGIAILKVGPALTFAFREGLFALSLIEKILVSEEKRANFIELLEKTMVEDPGYWIKHYHGTDEELRVKRAYSFSDRCRYYFAKDQIGKSIEKLFENLRQTSIPLSILHQYMPKQYIKVRDGLLPLDPKDLAEDFVVDLIEDYNYATKLNYMISGIFYK